MYSFSHSVCGQCCYASTALLQCACTELQHRGILEPVASDDVAAAVTRGRCLGVASLRFLPKTSTLRPIMNFSRLVDVGPHAGSSVNRQLQRSLRLLDALTVRTMTSCNRAFYAQTCTHCCASLRRKALLCSCMKHTSSSLSYELKELLVNVVSESEPTTSGLLGAWQCWHAGRCAGIYRAEATEQ